MTGRTMMLGLGEAAAPPEPSAGRVDDCSDNPPNASAVGGRAAYDGGAPAGWTWDVFPVGADVQQYEIRTGPYRFFRINQAGSIFYHTDFGASAAGVYAEWNAGSSGWVNNLDAGVLFRVTTTGGTAANLSGLFVEDQGGTIRVRNLLNGGSTNGGSDPEIGTILTGGTTANARLRAECDSTNQVRLLEDTGGGFVQIGITIDASSWAETSDGRVGYWHERARGSREGYLAPVEFGQL